MTLPSASRIIPGMYVLHNEKKYLVLDIINNSKVLAEDGDGHRESLEASFLIADTERMDTEYPDIAAIGDKEWDKALSIFNLIRPLIELGERNRTRKDVEKVAESTGKHIATVYRWLSDYESTGLVSALIRKRRKDLGSKKLDEEVEGKIKDTIQSFYLTDQKRRISKTAYEVRKVCKQNGLTPPNTTTVRRRIYDISEEERLRRREGGKIADERFEPIKGRFPNADFPLAVIQIDHTPMDVIIVDDAHRKPIGRPFLTSAIDVDSKMLTGHFLSLEHPGDLATGMCISRSILGKEILLSKLGIDNLEWPCWGVMRTLHTDNAKEFRGTLLGKAVEQYGIIAERRPKGRPKYGGHVERAFRTYMDEVHNELPGTTFSNIQQKLEYDSDGRAVMTLDALEKWFLIFILGVYHQKPHSGNDGLPPIVKWDEGIYGNEHVRGTGIPIRCADEDKLRLDFMPYFERTVQEYGIQIKGITYYTDALRKHIHSKQKDSPTKNKTYVCRYDPRDLSKIWMFDTDTNVYIEVPYSDISRPAISLWELRAAKKILSERSISVTNEELIFKSIDEMREIVDSESDKTKKARRLQQRMKSWKSEVKDDTVKKSIAPNDATLDETTLEHSDFEDFTPFEDIRES